MPKIEIDDIGAQCMDSGERLYKYKDCVDVSTLAMIDDLAGISKCGVESIELNTYINEKIKAKKLELGPDKCVKMHIKGKKSEDTCPTKLISETLSGKSEMKTVNYVKYLGDYISNDGSNDKNIEDRWKKGIGINCSIIDLLKQVSLGKHYFKIGIL